MYRTLRPSSFNATTFAIFSDLISAQFKQNVYTNLNLIRINGKTVINPKKRKKSIAAKRHKVSLFAELTIVPVQMTN
jgi:hypothetical protein